MKEGQIAPPSRPYADSLKTPEVVGVSPIITLLLPIWSAQPAGWPRELFAYYPAERRLMMLFTMSV